MVSARVGFMGCVLLAASCLDPVADRRACEASGRCEVLSDGGQQQLDAGRLDAGLRDAGTRDGGVDAGGVDAGVVDAGVGVVDAGVGVADASVVDAGVSVTDAGVVDAGVSVTDAGARDGGSHADSGVGSIDAGTACPGGRTTWLPTTTIVRDWATVEAAFNASIAAGRLDGGNVTVTVALTVPSPHDMFGGVLAIDGTIISVPSDTQQFHQARLWGSSGAQLGVTALSPSVGVANQGIYVGAVLGFDGMVYGMPAHFGIQPARVSSATSPAAVSLVGASYPAGLISNATAFSVVGLDGWAYSVPLKTGLMARIELSCPTHWQPLNDMFAATADSYGGAQLLPDGGIVAIPDSERFVALIGPTGVTSTMQLPANALLGTWRGAVLALNKKVYAMPQTGGLVLEVDTANNTVTAFDAGTADSYGGGVLGPDGLIYAMPNNADKVMVINPDTRTTWFVGTVDSNTVGAVSYKYLGGVLLPDGRIVGIPSVANKYLIIDPHMKSPPGLPVLLSPWLNKF